MMQAPEPAKRSPWALRVAIAGGLMLLLGALFAVLLERLAFFGAGSASSSLSSLSFFPSNSLSVIVSFPRTWPFLEQSSPQMLGASQVRHSKDIPL